jgi:lipase chaperone LimK
MRKMKRQVRSIAVAVIAAVALAGAAAVLRNRVGVQHVHRAAVPDSAVLRAPHRPATLARSAAAVGASAIGKAAAPDAPPPSLEGTDVDGALAADADGRLLVTPETRAFFDYFLTASEEEAPDQIRARIVAGIEARLTPDAAHAAIDLLDRYLAYRQRARQVLASASGPEEQLQQLRALRRAILGAADAEALFADEEARDLVTVQRLRIAGDASLTQEDREARLLAVEAQLPETERAARSAALLPAQLARDEAQLRAAGGTAAEVRTLRERAVGAEAADRLEALDRQRADWQARVDQYRADRDAIERDAARTPDERASAIAELVAERFTSQEQVRVRALERIAQEAAGGTSQASTAQ